MNEEPTVYVDLKEDEGKCTFSVNADSYDIDQTNDWVHVIRKGKKIASFKIEVVNSIYMDAIIEEDTK